jgi:hypothetical protein
VNPESKVLPSALFLEGEGMPFDLEIIAVFCLPSVNWV